MYFYCLPPKATLKALSQPYYCLSMASFTMPSKISWLGSCLHDTGFARRLRAKWTTGAHVVALNWYKLCALGVVHEADSRHGP
jgi:hypothetical protein